LSLQGGVATDGRSEFLIGLSVLADVEIGRVEYEGSLDNNGIFIIVLVRLLQLQQFAGLLINVARLMELSLFVLHCL
jgi:hypothetical protein